MAELQVCLRERETLFPYLLLKPILRRGYTCGKPVSDPYQGGESWDNNLRFVYCRQPFGHEGPCARVESASGAITTNVSYWQVTRDE